MPTIVIETRLSEHELAAVAALLSSLGYLPRSKSDVLRAAVRLLLMEHQAGGWQPPTPEQQAFWIRSLIGEQRLPTSYSVGQRAQELLRQLGDDGEEADQ